MKRPDPHHYGKHRTHNSLRVIGLLVIALVAVACSNQSSNSPTEVSSNETIFITPTKQATQIPTLVPLNTSTPIPKVEEVVADNPTPDPTQVLSCEDQLTQLYQQSSEFCLSHGVGAFCNGGLPVSAELASGETTQALYASGAIVPVNELSHVRSSGLFLQNSGGVLWLRPSEPNYQYDAMIIGDVDVQQSNGSWQSITVRTMPTNSACDVAPPTSMVIQSSYGNQAILTLNGVEIELFGTLVIQTDATTSTFIAIEGFAQLTVLGQARQVFSGQQVTVEYRPDSFQRPVRAPGNASPLDTSLITHLPIMLLDRPVLIPQPGYASTVGNVNMRAEPNVDSALLYRVPAGQTLSILGTSLDEQWFHIRLGNGETGWMKADLLVQQIGSIKERYFATPTAPARYSDTIKDTAIVAATTGSYIRHAPDTSFDIVASVPAGAEIELLARSPYSAWVKAAYGGVEGWVALITLETRAAIGFLPIDYNIPWPDAPTAVPDWGFGGGHAYPDPSTGY